MWSISCAMHELTSSHDTDFTGMCNLRGRQHHVDYIAVFQRVGDTRWCVMLSYGGRHRWRKAEHTRQFQPCEVRCMLQPRLRHDRVAFLPPSTILDCGRPLRRWLCLVVFQSRRVFRIANDILLVVVVGGNGGCGCGCGAGGLKSGRTCTTRSVFRSAPPFVVLSHATDKECLQRQSLASQPPSI